jgi:Domain of unknown function (DUF4129)
MRLNLIDRKWNWTDDGLLPYALAAMRAVWVWLLLSLLLRVVAPGSGDYIAPLTVFALLALGTLLTQYGEFHSKRSAQAAWLVALAGLAAVSLTLYLAIGVNRGPLWDWHWLRGILDNLTASAIVFFAAVWLWRLGILAGREPLTHDTFSRNFTIGVFALTLALAFAFATQVVPPSGLIEPILLFFGIGLGALAIASLQDTRRYERALLGEWFGLNRYWLGTVGAVIGVLLIAGFVLGQLFAPGIPSGIVAVLGQLLDLLAHVLLVIVLILAYVIFTLFDLIGRAFHLQPGSTNPPTLAQPPNIADQFKDLQGQPTGISPELFLLLEVVAGVLIAIVVLAIFVLAFRRFRVLTEADVEESRETIFSIDLLKQQLANLFARRSKERGRAVEPYVKVAGEDPRHRIRRTYQALLAWAAARGVPRSPGMTPNEYLKLMDRALHIYVDPIGIITDAYLTARYSAAPISGEAADEAKRAWEQIARENGKR